MISTSDSYAAFQRRLDRIFNVAQQLPLNFLGYSQSDVVSRITQRCAEIGIFEFTKIAAEIYRKTGGLPLDNEKIVSGGIFIDVDGKVRLTIKKFLRLLVEFLINWSYNFLSILFALRIFCLRRQVTLLYGVGLQDLMAEGSDARFLNFCRAGPIVPLSTSDYIFIQAQQDIRSTEPLRVRFVRNPLLSALRQSGLGLQAWTHALVEHFYVGYSFIWGVCKSPSLSLLGADAANHSIASVLNKQQTVKDIIFTNSYLFSQPLWFWALPNKTYSSHIVWYSQNSYPISYLGEAAAIPLPNLRYIKSDIQWVWSEGFKDFLNSLCSGCSYSVVGPIVWHLPSKIIKVKGNKKRITIFDVTPISQETENKFGFIRNIYSEKNATLFIRDIVEVANDLSKKTGVEIELLLKHKRPHHSIHSSEYIQKVTDFVDANQINLIEPSSNLYDLIINSDLVIVYPYSSPIILARELRRDAFWYDPTSTLEWMLGAPEFSLVQGRNSLARVMRKVLVKI